MMADMKPADRFQVQLGLLRVNQRPIKNEDGELEEPVKGSDRESRERAAMEAGLAAGLSREEALAAMMPSITRGLPVDQGLQWLDRNRGSLDLDEALASKARGILQDNDKAQGESPHVEAIQWASRIADPELRLRLCRAAFRRSLIPNKSSAETYLERNSFPADLTAEFRKILDETP